MIVTALAGVLALQGCATAPRQAAEPAPNQTGDACNPAIAAGVGAIVGALIAGGNDRVRGGAIGAGIAALACVAVNYHASQTKTAKQVEDEYRTQNNGSLPAKSTVTRFQTKVEPGAGLRPGGAATVNSYIEVAQGQNRDAPVVEQEIALFDPRGNPVSRVRKPANANGSAGGFVTSFKFSMPEGVPQGVYPVRSVVYLNGQPAVSGDATLQVVGGPRADLIAAIDEHERP